MKNKAIFVSFVALFAIALALNTVMATTTDGFVSIDDVVVNDISVVVDNAAGEVSNTVPVEIKFTANQDADDVRVKVYIEGYRDEISDATSRFRVVNGSTYIKRFSLELPSSTDLDIDPEDLSILVRISAKGEETVEDEFDLTMQRDLYSLNILSVDAQESVVAGSVVALDVVVENNGADRLDNVYVKASIPDLGVSRKVFLGDMKPVEEDDYDDIVDSTVKRIYMTIPRNAVQGIYNLEVEAYNYDASTTVQRKVAISGAETSIIPSVTSKTIGLDEETSFDLVLINPNDKMVVYSLTPEESKGLIVEIEQPIVTVASDSSKTAKVNVRATKSAEEGTHLITVNVNSETGLVKQVSFSVNVEEDGAVTTTTSRSNSVLVLTIVLAIIFVVLLIILIVLLTKKPAETEEFGETSYY